MAKTDYRPAIESYPQLLTINAELFTLLF